MDLSHLPLEQIASSVTAFLHGPYGPIVLWGCFVIALLNCFFGYTLRKVWCTLLGVLIGCAVGAGGAIYFHQSLQITLIAGAIGAFFGGAVAFALYRVGLFALCGGLTFFGLCFFFPTDSSQTLLFYLIAGIVVGILSNIYEHIVIILATSIGGGIGAMQLFSMINGGNASLTWLAGGLISLLGLIFQLKPWKAKGYWSERRSRDKASDAEYRNQRRRKRNGRASVTDRLSSLFGRKKKVKKKVRTVYETAEPTRTADDAYDDIYYDYREDSQENSRPAGRTSYEESPEYDGSELDDSDYNDYRDAQPYKEYEEPDTAQPQRETETPSGSPGAPADSLEFDYARLDPFDYAMEDRYSVKIDRSVFDKTQPDLSAASSSEDATKTFTIEKSDMAQTKILPGTDPYPSGTLRETAAAKAPGSDESAK